MVVIKLGDLALLHHCGLYGLQRRRTSIPFAPEGFGWRSQRRPGVIFFAYIGFDAVSTGIGGVEEPRSRPADRRHRLAADLHGPLCPGRHRRRRRRADQDPDRRATPRWPPHCGRARASRGPAACSPLGALIAITSVVLVIMYGQTRIFFAMCRDGLLPAPAGAGPPAVRHAGPADHRLRHPDRASWPAFVPLGRDRQAGQHRHAVRVRAGQHRRHRAAPDPAGHEAAVPGAALAGVARSSASLFCVYLMAQLPLRDLGAVRGLAGHRPDHLIQLLAPALAGPGSRRSRGRARPQRRRP